MDFKKILSNAVIEKRRDIHLRGLFYARTFEIEEFKRIFKLPRSKIYRHSSGFLYFYIRENMGLLIGNLIPKNHAAISIVVDQFGGIVFLMHPLHYKPENCKISIFKENSVPVSDLRYEREYLGTSYEDTFEGDSDAYWNID